MLMETGTVEPVEVALTKDMATLREYLRTWKLNLITPQKWCPAAFHLNNKEAKRELKVKYHDETLPFCSEPKYLGVTLDRSVTYRPHLESILKKLTSRVTLLRWLAGSGWGAGVTILRIATLALVHSTAALLLGAAVLIPTSSTPPSRTPCEFRLDAWVLQYRTTFQLLQASNLLNFVALEPHCL